MDYKKIIAFALWGGNPKFSVGAIRNAEIAKELFPDWICKFYINGIQQNTINTLKSFDNVELVINGSKWQKYGRRAGDAQPENSMFWKFYPYFNEDVSVFLARDVDSRILKREQIAVNEWLDSDKQFHIMRDHPGHCTGTPILGAMWGMKKTIGFDLKKLIDDYKKEAKWPMIDQWFLMKIIYPLVKDNSMIHHDESCSNGCQVPKSDPLFWTDGPKSEHKMFIKRDGLKFIGDSWDENEKPNSEYAAKLKMYIDTGRYYWKK